MKRRQEECGETVLTPTGRLPIMSSVGRRTPTDIHKQV